MGKLAGQILDHNILATSKLIRMVEEELVEADKELEELYPHTGNSHIIGITGLPGAGKSTIINSLISIFRKQNRTIGVVAIDPSSPYGGGSILGDRIRLMDHSADEKVLIKSVATRGWPGGVSKTAISIINIMDAMGKDLILVETAGVGQTEVDIVKIVHTTIAVLIPDMGDYIQIMKAGILEIADIFVINKSEKNIENALTQNLNAFLGLDKSSSSKWKPVVIAANALENRGIDSLVSSIMRNKEHFDKFDRESYLLKRAGHEINIEIKSMFEKSLINSDKKDNSIKEIIRSLALKKNVPKNAAIEILEKSGYTNFNKANLREII